MEGLMLARVLRDLRGHLPLRTLGWVFPDETTAALLLELPGQGRTNLVLSYRPPQPVVFLSRERLRGDPRSPFQRFLANRVRGDLLAAEQLKLDRVIALHFSGETGFVDQPPTRLLFEVTGRNANLLVLDAGEGFGGRIVMAAREITNSRNRFRTIRAAVHALISGEQNVTVVNRTLERAQVIAADWHVPDADFQVAALPAHAAPWESAALVVNASSAGLNDPDQTPLDAAFLTRLPAGTLVYDMVYRPAETRLMR
ncbi:NFACT family protein, partial [Deinococcus sp. 14RED07]|uniref:NFACT family protein n=1 Tax=Deinococcus sp. 14RED07 TaxID=2745874 RepID=UPI001E39CBD7